MKYFSFLKLFFSLCISSFALASLLYFFLNIFLQGKCAFGTFEGSSSYHCMFPYQYIAVLCFSAAVLLSLWIVYFSRKKVVVKYVSLFFSFILIVVLASVLGGILWATHEWIVVGDHRGMGWPGFYLFEIKNTLIYGWQALLKSFPLNVLALPVGFLISHVAAKYCRVKRDVSHVKCIATFDVGNTEENTKRTFRKGVAALILNSENELLLVNLESFATHFFAIPGGGIEKQETLEEAVYREIEEELGIDESLLRLVGKNDVPLRFTFTTKKLHRDGVDYDGSERYFFGFRFLGDSTNIRPQEGEVRSYKWASFEELKEYLLFENQLTETMEQIRKIF